MRATFGLRNLTNGKLVASRVARASGAWSRGIGLLGRAHVSPDEGLLIEGCRAVHTLGMRATLDLFFLDRHHAVLKIATGVRPNTFAVMCRQAASIVELGAGAEHRATVLVGDRLVLE